VILDVKKCLIFIPQSKMLVCSFTKWLCSATTGAHLHVVEK